MARDENALNNAQAGVLAWISTGCPDGVYKDDFVHRIVARGLHKRGLVTVSGSGASWLAVISAAGMERLTSPSPIQPELNPTAVDALWLQVINAGGVIRVDKSDDKKDYDTLLRLAMKSPLRPFAQKLESRTVGRYGSTIVDIYATDHFPDLVESKPVPIPSAVRKYHPLVRAYLDDREWQYVSKEHLTRAGHLLQAIASEAELRGLIVFDPERGGTQLLPYERRKVGRNPFAIKKAEAVYTIRVREIPGKGASRLDPAPWNSPNRDPAWQRKRGFQFLPTGKLELVIDRRSRTGYQGDIYRDAKSKPLEEQLPEIFRSFDIYALVDERDRVRRDLEAAARTVQWESAMEQARLDCVEQHRRSVLQHQFEAWANAKAMEQFLEEMRVAVSANENEAIRAGADEWLAWAGEHVNGANPLRGVLRMPGMTEPTPDELRPFLKGWSPHGPNSRI